MKLYGYFRSSAAYRVRIGLNLKGLGVEHVPVNLLKGEQASPEYTAINPQQLVPALADDGTILTQSLAILEYLEEKYPAPALLPADAAGRARVRALALVVACEMHPLNNVGVLRYLTQQLGASEAQKTAWYHHWLGKGFAALETMLAQGAGRFCHGDTPGLADCCLVPQVFNARRFDFDLSPYPTVLRIDDACAQLEAFQAAHPSRQSDAA
ncbi:MAG: maleylacetoacetate isomerase [Alphaproteobacteria bacterium]|nr:maleylacetoacetate isomerase [Alphaproteobacteria bacterium]